jgi:NAD(P)-dependent dehydrogenase (short-subunit alcohol dehydrogenase family)
MSSVSFDFTDKVALVTGAASGIGLATVKAFLQAGAQVIAVDRQAFKHDDELGHANDHLLCLKADVTQLDELKKAIDAGAAHFGGLDFLFSNAGAGGSFTGLENFDAGAWDHTFHLLFRSVTAGAAYALPHMRARSGGAIVNTSSISALEAGWAPVAYSCAKAAVLHFTQLAAAELAQHKIRINAVVPGFIATHIFGTGMGLNAQQSQAIQSKVSEASGVTNPLGRAGEGQDIAHAVLYLCSDAARFMTGSSITVDGGITMGPRHAWDLSQQNPLHQSLGITREQWMQMRNEATKNNQTN